MTQAKWVCFWCERPLLKREKTKDHLYCKFIRLRFTRRFGIENPKRETRHACSHCNAVRGRISSVFELICRFNENDWDGWTGGGIPNKSRYPNIIKKLCGKVNLLKFRSTIETKLKHSAKMLCLMEIDEILAFAAKHQEVNVKNVQSTGESNEST